MKTIRKIQYKFADAKIKCFTWWNDSSSFTSYCTFQISYENVSLSLYISPKQFHLFLENMSKNLSRYVALREKCPNTEFFLVRIFPHSDWIRVSLGIQSKCEKYGPEKNSVFGHFSRCVDSYDNITLIGDFYMTPEDKNLQHFTDTFILEYLIDKPNFSQRNSQAVLILLSPTKNHTSKKLV